MKIVIKYISIQIYKNKQHLKKLFKIFFIQVNEDKSIIRVELIAAANPNAILAERFKDILMPKNAMIVLALKLLFIKQ